MCVPIALTTEGAHRSLPMHILVVVSTQDGSRRNYVCRSGLVNGHRFHVCALAVLSRVHTGSSIVLTIAAIRTGATRRRRTTCSSRLWSACSTRCATINPLHKTLLCPSVPTRRAVYTCLMLAGEVARLLRCRSSRRQCMTLSISSPTTAARSGVTSSTSSAPPCLTCSSMTCAGFRPATLLCHIVLDVAAARQCGFATILVA